MPRPILFALIFLLSAAPTFGEYQLEIGPDTTVIDGPINPDGTINYLAYLNQKLSEGVTPENNFAVDVAMSMGEDAWYKESFREKVFLRLGVEIPAEGPFFVNFQTFLGIGDEDEEDDRRWEREYDASKSPWTTEQYPEVKRWLDEQGESLDRIVRRVNQKDRYYFPWIVAGDDPEVISAALLPGLGQLRRIARGFQARAQWNIAAGELDAAWSDVRAMHRMADALMQEPYVLSWLVSLSIHNMALGVVDDVVSSDRLTARFARQAIANSHSLLMLPDFAVPLDVGARLQSLDMLQLCWKGHGEVLELSEQTYSFMAMGEFDPNVTLREINRRINLFVEAAGMPDPQQRIKAMYEVDNEFGELYFQTLDMLKGDAEAIASLRAQIEGSNVYTVGGTHLFLGQTFARPVSTVRGLVMTQMRLQLQPVAFAIGGYHVEHGEYPPDLNALVPDYLDSLPTDFATGELPVYRVEDGVAIVYSLGTDLEDDSGVDDPQEGDIVFRIER